MEIVKNIAPIIGGLAIGDGIGRIFKNDMLGIPELIIGVVVLCYVFYLIFKK